MSTAVEIVRYADRADRSIRVGVRTPDGVAALDGVGGVAELLRHPVEEIRRLLAERQGETVPASRLLLLPPIDGDTEVWASGVTYERSKSARVEESTEKSVYERVYEAERPELFFKAVSWRVVTDRKSVV